MAKVTKRKESSRKSKHDGGKEFCRICGAKLSMYNTKEVCQCHPEWDHFPETRKKAKIIKGCAILYSEPSTGKWRQAHPPLP